MSAPSFIWMQRFAEDLTDDQIDARISILAPPVTGLCELPIDLAEHRLELALKAIFVSSAQIRGLLRALQDRCRCYSEFRYADQKSFLKHVHANDAEHAAFDPPLSTMCLTGLPGVGKSQVIAAFERLFPAESITILSHSAFVLRSTWRMTVKGGSSLRELVTDHFRHRDAMPRRGGFFASVQRELCTQGVASLHADELQALTQGEGNALPAKLLNQLGRFGPPLTYVANYSLLHRLNTRPIEEKQRLLSKILFMHPDAPDSADWRAFVKALLGTLPEFSELDFEKTQSLLYAYSFGLRRLAVSLLTKAYASMRRRRADHVESQDLDSAYSSSAYAASRADVEILAAGLEKTDKVRKDLWCPFPGSKPHAAETPNVVPHPSVKAYEQRLGQAALAGSMTPKERLASGLTEQGQPAKKSRGADPRPKATSQALLEGASAFRETLGPKS